MFEGQLGISVSAMLRHQRNLSNIASRHDEEKKEESKPESDRGPKNFAGKSARHYNNDPLLGSTAWGHY